MSAPVDPLASSLPSQFSFQSARQRVERVLAQLPLTDSQTRQPEPDRDSLVEPVQRINDVLRPYGVQFDLSDDSGRTIILVVDRESGQVIRQIPPEEALNAYQRMEEMKGRLLRLEV
ncbi:flagellar protein FlaG [Alcanivorax xiamenensis]|uniref:Flagellar protein FlaG n=1 Tax=Alcanivorax xiamenensis TaxID=1177156 RepID=A0ABQ6Y4D9_9GAMM|nr:MULTISPECIES: flagellar protein FlaG [Alcanivorax]KAF0804071.1 flagellar protein FlaG [Alcanivorax xiamenensis]